MASKLKKTKAAGRLGAGYGRRPRASFNKVEATQRKAQKSPYHPNGKAKRIAAGIWKCLKTGKVFAGPAYSLEKKN